jgi:hypothetical protein
MSAWRCEGEYLFLNHLFVLPSTQGRGVGTSLWSHGITHFQSRQPRYLALDVHDDNPKARSWYLALGMTVVGRKILWTSHPGNTAAETWRWPAGAEVPVRCLRPVPDRLIPFRHARFCGHRSSRSASSGAEPSGSAIPTDHHTTHVPRKRPVASRRPAGHDSFSILNGILRRPVPYGRIRSSDIRHTSHTKLWGYRENYADHQTHAPCAG